MKIGTVSLGCPKNLTDTEVILGKLVSAGHEIVADEKQADLLMINTCAFIGPAIDEAMSEIKKAVRLKEKGVIRFVVVVGCLPQRQRDGRWETRDEKTLKNVDAMIGSGNIDKIVDYISTLEQRSHLPSHASHLTSQRSCLFDSKTPRIKATPRHYAYIKIADGCDNKCAYCAVPGIRGPFKSRPIEDIIKEAIDLAGRGTKELILVAQDTTYFGKDIYGKLMLPKLLSRLCKIKGIKWIRLMYLHPAHFTDELIKVVAKEEKIVKYLDLPLQHICDNILTLMGRKVSSTEIVGLIAKIRESVPGVHMRTSLIVGFPGEDEKSFSKLLDFIKKERFERLGIFTYFRESGTRSYIMRGQVPEAVKKSRYRRAMRLQRSISRQINEGMIGKVVPVIIDQKTNNCLIGRSYFDAPDIDGSVLIKLPTGRNVNVGEIVKVRIDKASDYDLFGRLVT